MDPKAVHRRCRAALVTLAGALALLAALPAVAGACGNEAIREAQNSQSLPDCRAYEQVSPVDKNGGETSFASGTVRSAAASSSVTYLALAGFPGSQSNSTFPQYLSRRGSDWSTEGINPPINANALSAFTSPEYAKFTDELDAGAVRSIDPPLAPGAPEGVSNLYVRNLVSGGYTALSVPLVPLAGNPISRPYFGAGSRDFGKGDFESSEQMTPDTPVTAPRNLYVYGHGPLQTVHLPNGEAPAGGASAAGGATKSEIPSFGTSQGAYSEALNSVSDDGSTMFFNAPLDGSEPPQLYVWRAGSPTLMVSESKRGVPDPNGPKEALFQWASSDGSRVFFISSSALTEDSNTGPEDEGSDLYEFDVRSGQLRDLTPVASGIGARVRGVVGGSADGSYIYYVTLGDLNDPLNAGRLFLYVWHEGVTRLIGGLGPDGIQAENNFTPFTAQGGRGSKVTGDGTAMVFTSVDRLTSSDSNGHLEAYVYRYGSDSLECASCHADGSASTSDVLFGRQGVGIDPTPDYLPRFISEDGARVFFGTADRLVPEDTNNRDDVYVYENGQPHLISSGDSESDSWFGDASSSGNDVYFNTYSQLVGQDRDQNQDIYDARVDGGIAVQAGLVESTPCQGEACQPPASVAADDGQVGSMVVKASESPPAKGKKKSPKAKKKSCKSNAAKNHSRARTGKHQCAKHKSKKHKKASHHGGSRRNVR